MTPEASFKWVTGIADKSECGTVRLGRYIQEQNSQVPPSYFCRLFNRTGLKSIVGEGDSLAAAVHDCAVKFKEQGFK